MIALPEEWDWEVYGLYRILDEDVSAETSTTPALLLGERAFELMLARKVANSEEATAWSSDTVQRRSPRFPAPGPRRTGIWSTGGSDSSRNTRCCT